MTTQTQSLTDFLLARITEEEELAKAAIRTGEAGWRAESYEVVGVKSAAFKVAEANTVTAQHIALHDPARILAECEAKRRIVEMVERNVRDAPEAWVDRLLQTLALPYADHPDFRPEWRP